MTSTCQIRGKRGEGKGSYQGNIGSWEKALKDGKRFPAAIGLIFYLRNILLKPFQEVSHEAIRRKETRFG
jgi:hypothetical protein